ncbi:hypothetical protein Vi05172_g812 [Venturia inaequalis]|nr:hypothetical protein Vi05172_g812 [Venturia inaequalis]
MIELSKDTQKAAALPNHPYKRAFSPTSEVSPPKKSKNTAADTDDRFRIVSLDDLSETESDSKKALSASAQKVRRMARANQKAIGLAPLLNLNLGGSNLFGSPQQTPRKGGGSVAAAKASAEDSMKLGEPDNTTPEKLLYTRSSHGMPTSRRMWEVPDGSMAPSARKVQ